MKPLRFRDQSNMDAYAFDASKEEDTPEPLTYQEAVAGEDSSKWKNREWEIVSDAIGWALQASLKDYPFRDCDVKRMSKVVYANVVGSLMYLMDFANMGLVYGTYHGNHVDVTTFVDSLNAKGPDEVKYMTLTEAVKEAIWLRILLEELDVELNTVAANCDNQDTIHLSRNHIFLERTKHINVRYYFIKDVLKAMLRMP
ncbi:retrovirus-related pol polyprotein from transposon TNT 1-94 [Tanacetum coccineum]